MGFEEALKRFAKVKRPDLEKGTDAKTSVPDSKKAVSKAVSKKP